MLKYYEDKGCVANVRTEPSAYFPSQTLILLESIKEDASTFESNTPEINTSIMQVPKHQH